MGLRHKLSVIAAPLLRLFPPWWRVRLYAQLTGNPFFQGGFAGLVVRRCIAPHGFEMELKPDDWMERLAWLLGIYYEIEVTRVIQYLTRPDDIFVDIGANIGFITLLAAHCVGPNGKVIAVEPNPQLVARIRGVLSRNKIDNVSIVESALGAQEGSAVLRHDGHAGRGSLVNNVHSKTAEEQSVRLITGDSLISDMDDQAWCCVKIDVEGYEQQVLNGITRLIARPRTAFIIEITDEWLRQAGGSAAAVFALMHDHGYRAYLPTVNAASRFLLKPLDGPRQGYQFDAVFLRPADCWSQRPAQAAA